MYNYKFMKYVVVVVVVLVMVVCGSDGMFIFGSVMLDIILFIIMFVKNVVFFLGDGMGMIIMIVVCIYKVGEDGELIMDMLLEIGFVCMYLNNV